jgi:E3 ubiquitin-protein ligase RBX1
MRFASMYHLIKQDAAADKVAGSSQPPRFEIKKWNAVAMWSWDICADTVRFCR